MKPASFEYHAPRTVDEALALLAEHAAADGRILAGGQSLVPAMALRLAQPAHLIDINGVQALQRPRVEGSALIIPACVRHAELERGVEAGCLGALLRTVARHIGHLPIRTRGTFCGSLANADPASEWCLVAATLDAELEVRSVRGTRTLAAADFFQGAMSTALAPDELLVEARVPLLPEGARYGFVEFSRRAGDFALGMVLACLSTGQRRMRHVRLGVGGAEAVARRIPEAERLLEGEAPSADLFRAAAHAAAQALDPLSDARTSAEYRRELVGVLARRALEAAL